MALADLKTSLVPSLVACKSLIHLHTKTGVESTGEYLTQEEDRQVGLGMLGLANLLSIEGVTYAQFGEALNAELYPEGDYIVTPEARKIVKALQDGINAAADIARKTWTERLQLHLLQVALIATETEQAIQRPPNWHLPSGALLIGTALHLASNQFFYGEVETAEQVGWDNYKRVVDGIMEMLNRTGLAHGYSLQQLERRCHLRRRIH